MYIFLGQLKSLKKLIDLGYKSLCFGVEAGTRGWVKSKPKSPASIFHDLLGFLFFMDSKKKKRKFFFRPRKVVFKDLTDKVRVLAAEIIDSGYVKMVKSGYSYRVNVTIRTENLGVAHFLRRHFGGYYWFQQKDGNEYHWINFQQHRAEMVLHEIFPFLKAKKRHAEIIFSIKDHIRGKVRQHKLTAEDKAFRAGLLSEIKRLNKNLYYPRAVQDSQESSE